MYNLDIYLYTFIHVNMVIYLLNIVECWVWFLKNSFNFEKIYIVNFPFMNYYKLMKFSILIYLFRR